MRTDMSIPLHVYFTNVIGKEVTKENVAELIAMAASNVAIFYQLNPRVQWNIPALISRDAAGMWCHTRGILWWSAWHQWARAVTFGYGVDNFKDKAFNEQVFSTMDETKAAIAVICREQGVPMIGETQHV